MELPTFKYHPDPIATGAIVESAVECVCCGTVRGYIYAGPVYGADWNSICPWCIADGSAYEQFEAIFQDEEGVGGDGQWDKPSARSLEEVTRRTPGYMAWQQSQWWTHCGEAAQYLGPAGYEQMVAAGPDTVEAVRASSRQFSAEDWQEILRALKRDDTPSAYLFKCFTCGKVGGYWESIF